MRTNAPAVGACYAHPCVSFAVMLQFSAQADYIIRTVIAYQNRRQQRAHHGTCYDNDPHNLVCEVCPMLCFILEHDSVYGCHKLVKIEGA